MDEPALIAGDAGSGAGLDAEGLMARAQAAEIKAKLQVNTDRAVERGHVRHPHLLRGRGDLLRQGFCSPTWEDEIPPQGWIDGRPSGCAQRAKREDGMQLYHCRRAA